MLLSMCPISSSMCTMLDVFGKMVICDSIGIPYFPLMLMPCNEYGKRIDHPTELITVNGSY